MGALNSINKAIELIEEKAASGGASKASMMEVAQTVRANLERNGDDARFASSFSSGDQQNVHEFFEKAIAEQRGGASSNNGGGFLQ